MKTARAAKDVPAAPITGVTLVVRQLAHAPGSVLKGVYIQGGNEVLFSIVHFAPEHRRRAGPGKLTVRYCQYPWSLHWVCINPFAPYLIACATASRMLIRQLSLRPVNDYHDVVPGQT